MASEPFEPAGQERGTLSLIPSLRIMASFSPTHSAFELLYMILYIGGGHTAGCAVRAFVCLQ